MTFFFQHSVIFRLLIQCGPISSSLMQSLTKTLSASRISVKTLIIHNCRCDCTVLELINFIKCTHVEVLAIDVSSVFNRQELEQSLAKHEIVQNMICSLVYVDSYDVDSEIVEGYFSQGPIKLNEFSQLLRDWGRGFMEIVHFHTNIDDDEAVDVNAVCQDPEDYRYLRGRVLNRNNEELHVEAKNGRLMLTPGSLSQDSQVL
ncbi:hypothetical protein GCK32_001113 [Trichostrongylus colubriformis]|uniref:Uncharacterized protein n=1 Tax=Trichostrongylus colubriformis TaxID=6319 RepID=A0AAN8EMG9_TRICO